MSACLPPKLALVGLRCSGKTTAGRLLAERLGFEFVDLDERIAARAGAAHAGELIVQGGLDAFRILEAQELKEVLGRTARLVLSTGGGAIENERSRELLKRHAVTVWLRAPLDVLRARAAEAEAQNESGGGAVLRPPLLDGASEDASGRADEWAILSARRAPLYRDVSRRAIDVEGLGPSEIALRLEEIWR